MQSNQIPVELRAWPQWVLWKKERRKGKLTKILFNPRTGKPASSTDPSTWGTFDEAVEGLRVFGECDGLGFVFSATDPYVAIDLDECVEETGELAFWASEIISEVNTYTEYSQSKRGVHAIARGLLPPHGRKRGPIEMYSEGRFFVMTGAHLAATPAGIEERGAELLSLHARVFGTNGAKPAVNGTAPVVPLEMDDRELIDKARAANRRFDRLWSGDTTEYPSASEADLAMCDHLAFWCGRDTVRMDRLFRQSGLMREKWERTDYREETLRKAVIGADEVYRPARQRAREPEGEEANSVVNVVKGVSVGKKAEPPAGLEPEALCGLPGEVVRTLAPHTESHPAAILASFLVGAGCLLGRGPFVPRDAARHFPNEFMMIVGKTAAGRKGTATRRVEEIFKSIFDTNYTSLNNYLTTHDMSPVANPYSDLTISGLGSGEALIETLADEDEDRRRLIFQEEFSSPLKVMRREGSILSETLRSAWDGSILSNRTKGKKHVAIGTHICVLGHITDEELAAQMNSVDIFNGFANRFLWFYTRRTGRLPFGGGRAPIAQVVMKFHQALGFAKELHEMEFDEDAARLWDEGEVYDLLRERPDGLFGAVTSRAESHVTRIALLYAVLDMQRAIRVRHLLAALAVWDYSERTCRFLFSRSTGDQMADHILDLLLEAHPGFVTRTELRDHFKRNAKPGSIQDALDLLHAQGKADFIKLPAEGQGKRAEGWFAKTSDRDALNDQNDLIPLFRARRLVAEWGLNNEE